MSTVAVVGGGMAGLSAAWRLLEVDPQLDVVVLEATDRVGGKLALDLLDDVVVDTGAESMLARRPEAVALARAVGLGEQLVSPRTSGASVYSRGAFRALPAGTLMGVPSRTEGLDGLLTGGEVRAVVDERARTFAPLDADVSVGSFVASRVGRAVVDRLVEPLLGGVYAGRADALSLRATVPGLWAAGVEGRSAVEAAARAAAAGEATQAPVFVGLRGGVGTLPLAVAGALAARGARLRTGVTVRRLARTPDGWRLVSGPSTREEAIDVDAVVLAIPAAPASRLLAALSPSASSALAGIEYASLALVSLLLPADHLAGQLAGSGFLVPPVERRLVKAATYSSAKWEWVGEAARGRVVVRTSFGRHREERDLQLDDDELVRRAVADLSDVLALPLPQPLVSRVTRWGGGLPQYAVGHVDRVDLVRRELAAVAGLEVAGAAYDGVGVPACVASGTRAADAVLTHLERPAGRRGE